MTITNLTTLVPVQLDIDEMNYSSWTYFFKNLCKGHDLLKHILGNSTDEATSSNPFPPTAEWLKIDSIIFLLGYSRLYPKPFRHDFWLKTLKWLRNPGISLPLGSAISDDDVVNIALEGLPDKYKNVSGIIVHREPFLDLKMVCSMLTTEEMRLKSRAQATSNATVGKNVMVRNNTVGTNNMVSTPTVSPMAHYTNTGSVQFYAAIYNPLGFFIPQMAKQLY
ncbi:hypothetical protein Tco_0018482 [Tanacetum coccineum]